MRTMKRGLVVLAGLAMTTVPLAAQGGPGRGPAMGRGMMAGGPEAMARNPVTVMLEHRDVLELTEDQIRTLEGFEARIQEENGPRWERLKEAFGDADPMEMTADEREALRERMRELQPVRDEIRETNRSIMDQVHELLTAEQEDALHGIMMRRMGPDGRPGMRGMRGRRGGDAAIGAAWRSGYRDGLARGIRAGRGIHRPFP